MLCQLHIHRFLLGEKESYLWAVRREGVRLYQLLGQGVLNRLGEEFRTSLKEGRPEAEQQGRALYIQLFGHLKAEERAKRKWTLSLEGKLFDVPFSALVVGRREGRTEYLMETHTLQVVPGAFLRSPKPESGKAARTGADGEFLGVGDPIYNAADPRWRAVRSSAGAGLNRLPGSGAEVEASAASWTTDRSRATVLVGDRARRQPFLTALRHGPAVVHLATHVQIPDAARDQGFIAFGLAPARNGREFSPEYLDTQQVSSLNLPGSLVVMTGCETGGGDSRTGAGLLGLTRAWLMAGANAVITTGWPVDDTNGELFERFYKHLHHMSPADALRQSQVEMLHTGDWQASPAYWSAFQITGRMATDVAR